MTLTPSGFSWALSSSFSFAPEGRVTDRSWVAVPAGAFQTPRSESVRA